MPTVDENLSKWGKNYGWQDRGDEWSSVWGGPEAQWFFVLYPRIHRFLPAATVLEIAPGHGRWTQFLRQHCERLEGVDLSPVCVEACQRRFSDWPEATFHVNDGHSLPTVADGSVDFAFSFDSLVHAEWDVLADYLRELARVLAPEGAAFLHHSDMATYATGLGGRLVAQGENHHWRGLSVSGKKLQEECGRLGLACISQERINWGSDFISDCLSIVVRQESPLARDCVVIDNPDFMREAEHVARVSRPYVREPGNLPAAEKDPADLPRPTLRKGSWRLLARRLARR